MRITSLLVAAALPGLAACTGSAETAQLDLKDACVFTPAPAGIPSSPGHGAETALMEFNGRLVPYRRVSATLIKPRAEPAADSCSGHIG